MLDHYYIARNSASYGVLLYTSFSAIKSSTTTLNVIVETHLVAFGVASTNQPHFSAFFIVQQQIEHIYFQGRSALSSDGRKLLKANQNLFFSFLWLDGVLYRTRNRLSPEPEDGSVRFVR